MRFLWKDFNRGVVVDNKKEKIPVELYFDTERAITIGKIYKLNQKQLEISEAQLSVAKETRTITIAAFIIAAISLFI